MNDTFANRMHNVRRSFIREILKVTERPEIISFAGGLPNPRLFPVQEIADAALKVLQQKGESVLQYSTTEGYLPLREYIAKRYLKRHRLEIDPDEILITNGSQQGLDLIAKVFLDRGEQVVIERPGYLGAIQAFSLYEPEFQAIELFEDGIDTEALERTLETEQIKLFYTVPNFQNPSGISYSEQKRQDVARLLKSHKVILVEDDPYGELRFMGRDLASMRNYLNDRVFLLGSFSKIVSPGLRLGWICGQEGAMEKLIIAKQASDLHSNHLSQRIVHQYLLDNDLDEHVLKIRKVYKEQRDVMVSMIEEYFPEETNHTRPEGGMFLWITLPQGISSLDLFDQATQLNVAFVPGQPFYVDGGGENTLRLNFSNTDEGQIEEGIKRLAEAIKKLMA